MNLKLNQKIVKELCGTVSFKRGDSFYRSRKVSFLQYSSEQCVANVTGKESFQVTIEKEQNGSFQTSCTCPSLSSFQKDCQHIAAVLIAIDDHQKHGTIPAVIEDHELQETIRAESDNLERQDHTTSKPNEQPIESEGSRVLANKLLNLFSDQPKRSSGKQLHFENRQVLETEFICKIVKVDSGNLYVWNRDKAWKIPSSKY